MQVIPIRAQTARRLETRGATLAVALAAGLAAALLAFLLVRGRLTDTAAAPRLVSVVVASQDVPPRTRLTASMLLARAMVPADVPPGAAASPAALLGKVTTQAISAGKAVTSDTVTSPSAALGLAFALPPSLRAVTVATDPADGVELFLRPGDHVDILATSEPGSGLAEARTALQNVRLLAVGTETSSDASAAPSAAPPPSAAGASHVTVAVTPAQAQILVLAAARGKLHLALRAADDSGAAALPAMSASAAGPVVRPLPRTPKARPLKAAEVPAESLLPLPPLPIALPPARVSITVIKGTVSQTVSVTP